MAQRGDGNEPIALLLENDASMIAGILGVLKAGKIYVPLDPSLPSGRLAYMLEDSQARLIVTNTHNMSLLSGQAEPGRYVLNVDEISSSLSEENLGLSLPPDTLAYILYTSGSTGRPKGVVHNHCNVLHFVRNYTNDLHITTDDRQSLLFSCNVAAAVKNIFGALLNGAMLLLLNLREEGLARLSAWLSQEGITLCHAIPTVFRHFVSNLTGKEVFPKLRVMYLTGEPVFKSDVEMYKAHFSSICVLVNGLAATELNTSRQYFIDRETQISSSLVPVGYGVEDTEILLLDEAGAEVSSCGVGEIAIKSRYLALGYWRQPELTRTVFEPVPAGSGERIYRTGDLGRMLPDGCLEHLGRKDFQVKIRGHRVDLIEIEAVLGQHPGVRDTVVLAREDEPGDPSAPLRTGPSAALPSGLRLRVEDRTGKRLAAYVVPSQAQAPVTSDLRNFLKERLPDYMVPSAFTVLDSLPLTPNGKVDRRALPVPAPTRPDLGTPFVAPRNPTEEVLGGIWSEVLGIDQVGIIDNFFELGGDSLLATTVISRVIQRFQVELPVQLLFQNPTVAGMAVVIMQNQAKKAGKEEMAGMVAELELLPDKEARRLLTEKAETERRREKWIEKTEKTIRSTK